ncbi:MAG: NAD(+)/NADH kinase [Elusimicrobia bacterium]|nr:NAD(+)/NADH kinase [Elusimicrobiota bacterium]
MNWLRRAVLVPKESKLEYDQRRLGWSRQRLLSWYRDRAGVIVDSHDRQLAVRQRLLELFPECRVVPREMVDAGIDKASLVIALGGDNHFIYVSHFLRKAPILGVNADRVRSHGGLLELDERQLEAASDVLRAGWGSVSAWPRLEVRVGGRFAGLATSELFIGERQRKHMSRHVLRVGELEEEHKSSGLLVSTPAGSTGWYGHYGKPFTADARWVLTEPFPRGGRLRLGRGVLTKDRTLKVRSLNDAEGIVAVDSLEETPFTFAAQAEVRLSKHPLHVVGMEGL